MLRFRVPHNHENSMGSTIKNECGAALLEFAIALPLLVVFVVGIFDFSGAFNQKQKVEQAVQEGAIVAGAQPMGDIATTTNDPESLHPVVSAVFNSLAGSGVLPNANVGGCAAPGTASPPTALKWTYTIPNCPNDLVITIDRGSVSGVGSLVAVETSVQVAYPYHWRFNSVIQVLFPGANYAAVTSVTESATVHNQL